MKLNHLGNGDLDEKHDNNRGEVNGKRGGNREKWVVVCVEGWERWKVGRVEIVIGG